MTPRIRYWSRHMRPKLLGGCLIGAALLVLVATQVLFTQLATVGWFAGLALFVVGGLLMLDA